VTKASPLLGNQDFEIRGDLAHWYDFQGDSYRDPELPTRIIREMLGRKDIRLVEEHNAGNGHFSARIVPYNSPEVLSEMAEEIAYLGRKYRNAVEDIERLRKRLAELK